MAEPERDSEPEVEAPPKLFTAPPRRRRMRHVDTPPPAVRRELAKTRS